MNLTGKVILILFFIAIVFYNIRHSQYLANVDSKEPFVASTIDVPIDRITSTDIYEKNKGIMCDTLYYGSDFLTDINDTFQARYCLKYVDATAEQPNYDYAERFKQFLSNGMNVYVQSQQMDTMEMDSIRANIQTKLLYFKLANSNVAPVQGPVYAILTQAPYMLDDTGDVIYHQPFNRSDYPTNTPTFAVANKDKVPPVNGIRVYLHLVYLMYDRNRTPVNATASTFNFNQYYTQKMATLQGLKVDSNLCNIKCIGDGGLLCGCVNQTKPYESHCLGPLAGQAPVLQNTNKFSDYMMLYRINERASRISNLFSSTYFEDVKI